MMEKNMYQLNDVNVFRLVFIHTYTMKRGGGERGEWIHIHIHILHRCRVQM